MSFWGATVITSLASVFYVCAKRKNVWASEHSYYIRLLPFLFGLVGIERGFKQILA